MKTKDGLWKLSPSGLYTYEDCQACFWVEQHLGRAPSIPMRLNDAMDEKLKARYDGFRAKQALPPELAELKGIRLFDDQDLLEQWRSDRTALRVMRPREGYVIEGKLDEVLVSERDELIPADFKSSGDEPKADKQKYYRLQLHAYALMLQEHGYQLAKKAYLLHYFTRDRRDPSLAMEFKSHVDEVAIDLGAFERTLREMVTFLNRNYPGSSEVCGRCVWHEKRRALRSSRSESN